MPILYQFVRPLPVAVRSHIFYGWHLQLLCVFSLDAEKTALELIWYSPWLISELFPPSLKLQCLLFTQTLTNWEMWEELLWSWLRWVLLCLPSSVSSPQMLPSCKESWTLVCHRYGGACIRVVAWRPPTLTRLPFAPPALKTWGLLSTAYEPEPNTSAGHCLFAKEKSSQRCHDGQSAAEHKPGFSTWDKLCRLERDNYGQLKMYQWK